jgi:hypothetical protein
LRKPQLLRVTRDVTKEECHWLKHDIIAGTIVYRFTGHTYGCVSYTGQAVTDDPTGDYPFYELPNNALEEIK